MKGIMYKVNYYRLERFFENKDTVTFDEIVDKLYELDDEKELYKEKYEDLKEEKKYEPDYDEIGKDMRMGI